MKQIFTPILIVFVLLSSLSFAQNVHKDYIDGELWVNLNENYQWRSDQKTRSQNLSDFAFITNDLIEKYQITAVLRPFFTADWPSLNGAIQLSFKNTKATYNMIEEFTALEVVDFAEQVPLLKTQYTPDDMRGTTGNMNAWHLWQINAPDAWDLVRGNPEVIVAIVDDAVEVTHSDLSANTWINSGEIPNNGIDDDGNGFIDDYNGVDVTRVSTQPNPPSNQYSHGIHVAGISGASTDNGIGLASIGFGVTIMGIKATTNPGFVNEGYDGITYAADNGARIINCSWGGGGSGLNTRGIINYATSKGAIVVAGAGNDDVNSVFYPAGYENAVAVASTRTSDIKSNFSNYGNWIDIAAPGTNIWSLDVNNGYRSASGTSMASPLVAGLLGLMASVDPSVDNSLLLNCLYSSADNIDAANPNYIGQLGAGRINAEAAVACVINSANSAPLPNIYADKEQICPGDTVTFSATSSGGSISTYSWYFPGGTPQNSIAPNPQVIYTGTGAFDVQLTLGNQFGANTITNNDVVIIDNNSRSNFFYEDFETNIIDKGWQIDNPDNSNGWIFLNVGGTRFGSRAGVMSLFGYNNIGERDALVSPLLDFSKATSFELSFDHAYRRVSTTRTDSFIVSVSTDGGASFPHAVFAMGETGQGTLATATTSNSNFVPSSSNDWCYGGSVGANCFKVDLSQFAGEKNVKIKFETVNNNGNNFFLDNVEIISDCFKIASNTEHIENEDYLLVYPNPNNGKVNFESNEIIEKIVFFDLTGKIVKEERVQATNHFTEMTNLKAGVYFCKVYSNKQVITKKLIKQ